MLFGSVALYRLLIFLSFTAQVTLPEYGKVAETNFTEIRYLSSILDTQYPISTKLGMLVPTNENTTS